MITGLEWVGIGKFKTLPERYEPTQEEIAQAKEEALRLQKGVGGGRGRGSSSSAMEDDEDDDVMKEFDLDNYDDDEEDAIGKDYHEIVEEDQDIDLADEDEEDLDDITIRPTDSILLSVVVAGEHDDEEISPALNIHVYEEEDNNIYVHHDVQLQHFPLCVAFTDFNVKNPTTTSSFAAVGSYQSSDPRSCGIEIWNLDVIDAPTPTTILGGDFSKQNKNSASHRGSVMDLSWNSLKRNIIASASDDKTVKIWDMSSQQCVQTFCHHSDKVQSVQWHPKEEAMMVTGSYDKTVKIIDARSNNSITSLLWDLPFDCESVVWSPLSSPHFFAACEDGTVMMYDAMKGGKTEPIWTLSAHSDKLTAFTLNPSYPLFATSDSKDNVLRIWNYATGAPVKVLEKDMNEETVFTLGFMKESPHILAIGGDKGDVKVINLLHDPSFSSIFGVAAKQSKQQNVSFPTTSAESDDDDDDDNNNNNNNKKKNKKKKKNNNKKKLKKTQ